MKAMERRQIEQTLRQTRGNVSQAAELLGISRRTMYRKLHEYGLQGDGFRG